MINEHQIKEISKHKVSHDVGMCRCPCFAALIQVGEALATERRLMTRLAKASPEVAAALIIASGGDDGNNQETEDGDHAGSLDRDPVRGPAHRGIDPR